MQKSFMEMLMMHIQHTNEKSAFVWNYFSLHSFNMSVKL